MHDGYDRLQPSTLYIVGGETDNNKHGYISVKTKFNFKFIFPLFLFTKSIWVKSWQLCWFPWFHSRFLMILRSEESPKCCDKDLYVGIPSYQPNFSPWSIFCLRKYFRQSDKLEMTGSSQASQKFHFLAWAICIQH